METMRENYLIMHAYKSVKKSVSPNGKERTTVLHIVFKKDLPTAEDSDVVVKNILSLTEKQVNYLANILGLQGATLDITCAQVAKAIGISRSYGIVSSEYHEKGEKYVDPVDKVEKTYTKSWFNNKLDSVKLPESLTDMVDKSLAKIMLGNYESVNGIDLGGEPEMQQRTL